MQQRKRWNITLLKGCVRYIFASLFFKFKREHLSNYELSFQSEIKNIFPCFTSPLF